MPIGKADILAVLADPVLTRMNFSVGEILVNAGQYSIIAEYIRDGDIGVIPGKGAVAFYDGTLNTIETQAGNAPLGVADRAQILHECTHAISDTNRLDVLRMNDEVAAFLAQVTYMHISDPNIPFPTQAPGAGPMGRLIIGLNAVILKYNLHQTKGFGVSISELDIWNLANDIRHTPEHAAIKPLEKARHDPKNLGVPIKNNQMRALRAALRGARRQTHVYTPSPRIEIF